jgi:formyltetrahydrofolate hydrolase
MNNKFNIGDKVRYYGLIYEVIEKDLLTDVYRLKGEIDETSAIGSDLELIEQNIIEEDTQEDTSVNMLISDITINSEEYDEYQYLKNESKKSCETVGLDYNAKDDLLNRIIIIVAADINDESLFEKCLKDIIYQYDIKELISTDE